MTTQMMGHHITQLEKNTHMTYLEYRSRLLGNVSQIISVPISSNVIVMIAPIWNIHVTYFNRERPLVFVLSCTLYPLSVSTDTKPTLNPNLQS